MEIPTLSAAEARELAIVARTLKDERIMRTRNANGAGSPDDTALALGRMQFLFEAHAHELDAS